MAAWRVCCWSYMNEDRKDQREETTEAAVAGSPVEAPVESPAETAATPDEPITAQEVATAEASASEAEIAATVEAILFASDSALPASKIAQVGELGGQRAVKQAVATLNERYEQVGAAFRIEEIGGGYQMLTQSRYHDVLERLTKARGDSKLSQAAMETLAIIAYRQPILRADVEAIRGVASGEVLRGLLEKGLVKIVGRAEVIGRPMLYGTTRRFLDVFGLGSLEDLPRVEELRSGAKETAAAPATTTPPTTTPAPADAPATTTPATNDAAQTAATDEAAQTPAPPEATQSPAADELPNEPRS